MRRSAVIRFAFLPRCCAELIENVALRERAAEILSRRNIFTPRCLELIDLHDAQGHFTEAQAREFVQEALETFRWHRHATVDQETYLALSNEHRLIADVVCFPGCHINHLTPRTLDIDRVQELMPKYGIEPKILIEGPPRREVPILLRQTSFKALEEPVLFAGNTRAHIPRVSVRLSSAAWRLRRKGASCTTAC